MVGLRTRRLALRQWRETDRVPFAALNADPEVMRHFPAPLTRAQSDALATREASRIAQRGWGLWAVEIAQDTTFIGFVGLAEPTFEARFTPAVEVGWRLARGHWGNGYAVEAARAAIGYGFQTLALPEIVSFTTTANERSRSVMQRLGMTHDAGDDFQHPLVGPDDPLCPHVLYRLSRAAWQQQRGAQGSGSSS